MMSVSADGSWAMGHDAYEHLCPIDQLPSQGCFLRQKGFFFFFNHLAYYHYTWQRGFLQKLHIILCSLINKDVLSKLLCVFVM